MIGNSKNIYFLFLYFFSCIAAAAQDPFSELEKIRATYTSLDSYSLRLNIKAYKGHASMELVDVLDGAYEVSGERYRYRLGNTVILKNENYLISIDERYKEIDIVDSKKQTLSPAADFMDFKKMETVLKKHNALGVKEGSNGNKVLVFDLKKSGYEYEKIEIRYRPSGEITAMILYYRLPSEAYDIPGTYKMRMEITYDSQKLNATFSPDHFSEKKYVNITDKGIFPQPPYKNYQISDLL